MESKRSRTGVVLRFGLILLGLILLFAGGWITHAERSIAAGPGTEQPIQFNHALHAQNNVKCLMCHPYYETTPRAGMPGVNTCRRCHEGVILVSPEERKIEAYYQGHREIPWRRVYQVPRNVYFSHRRHVALGEIECRTCHGDVATQTKPLVKPLVVLKMNDCIACHQRQQQRTNLENVQECIRCHR